MSSNYNLQTDLNEAKAMADSLEEYVRGNELYGHASGGFFSNMPSLTIGALIMRLRRLDALRDAMNDRQYKELDKAMDKWQAVRDAWRVHYEEKLQREAESRLDAMRTFFKECADSMQNCRNNYRPELLRRSIVQELVHEMQELNLNAKDLHGKISETDSNLHAYLRADDFQWSEMLMPVYPKEEFWWLYQKPPMEDEK